MTPFALLLLASCSLRGDATAETKPADSTAGGDSGTATDLDGDGFLAADDCNDNLDWVHPGASDWCGNDIDEDCVDGDCELFGITVGFGANAILTGEHDDDIDPRALSLLHAPGTEHSLLTTGEDALGNAQIYVFDFQARGASRMADVAVRLTGTTAKFNEHAFAGVGDLDGDGHGDLVVTMLNDVGDRDTTADAYAVHGPFDSARSFTDSGPAVVGGDWDGFGEVVARAGDVNDDGLDDVWIGAPHADNRERYLGAITLWFGPLDHRREINESDGWWETKDAPYFGERFLNPGDLDGEGHDDLLIVVNNWDGVDCGLYLVLNPGAGVHDLVTADARWCISAFDIDEVAFARNASGDGQVVVALDGSTEEEILFFDGDQRGELSADDARAVVHAGQRMVNAGAAADWDGDGSADLAVSQSGSDALLFRGPFEGSSDRDDVDGRMVLDSVGYTWRMLGVPDLDDDGDDELVATSSGDERTGAVYLFLGSPY